MDNPILLIMLLVGAAYVGHMWWQDLKSWRAGKPVEGGMPGATDATLKAHLIGISGALVLLIAETWGEIALGIASEQSEMALSFALYAVLGAPIIEELILRGFLFFDQKGDRAFWTAALGCSIAFALAHPHLWNYEDGSLTFDFGLKAWFSTTVLFTFSLWLYAIRYLRFNTHRSLAVPISAHAAKNLGVVLIKWQQGFLVLG